MTSLLLSGALVSYPSSAEAGYYSPWFAAPSANVQTLNVRSQREGDETAFWGNAGSVTLNGVDYTIFVRTTPLTQSKNLRCIFKNYE